MQLNTETAYAFLYSTQ